MQMAKAEVKGKGDVLATPGHLISVAARAFARLSEARLGPLGFGVGYVPVLTAIAGKEGERARTQREIGQMVRIEQPSVAQMLGRMERDGLVKRVPDPQDGRGSQAVLTRLAKSRLPGACEVLMQGNREALAGFSEEEAAQFVDMLGRLIANLDRLNGAREQGGSG
jgi:DNA-binding MarR family transcriptional regulator